MWWLLLLPIVAAGPSQRGKCSLECFVRCMQSGTPSSAQCNCPVERVPRRCSSVEAKLLRAEIIPDIADVHTEYVDSHTIRITMAPLPAAFAYIFEYSTISTQPDDWYFAGASANPTVTFAVLDPCRDYQFRVIVVVRSTDPEDHLVVFRPRAIPVELPPFSLNPTQISVDIPPRNATLADMLKVYVRWTLPRGYSDGDIYGYEAPALYPIQCHTPEEELPQPKIEIMRSGGRLAITLPSSVLEARCRLWAEVRMLPRCVRLEPHSIQKNIEIDCEKTPSIEIYINPICTESVEINGVKGKAELSWTSPIVDAKPLYYHLRYGPAQMKGSPPFVTWQLATKKDVKVDGSVTSIGVEIPEDEDYGVQVCAIMTPHRKRAKFGLVRVTPFQCTSCNVQSTLSVGSCGHCGVIEGTTVMEKSWNKRPPSRTTSDEDAQEQEVIPQTVFNIGADLTVNQSKGEKKSAGGTRTHTVKSVDTVGRVPVGPLPIERAEEINRAESPSTTTVGVPSTSSPPSTTTTVSTTTTEAATTTTPTTTTPPETTTTAPLPRTAPKELAAKIVEVGTDLHHLPEKELVNNRSITDAFEKLKAGLRGELAALNNKLHEHSEEKIQKISTIEPIVLNTTIQAIELSVYWNSTQRTFRKPETVNLVATDRDQHIRKATKAALIDEERAVSPRSSPSGKKCLLANGVVCALGCLSKTTCVCPPETHDLAQNGGCTLKKQKSHHCLSSAILSATWDPMTMNILVRSELAARHLRTAPVKDRLFVEFGRVVDHGSLSFVDKFRQKMVVGTEKLLKSGIFSKEPFIFHVNETIDIESKSYGMRLCTFEKDAIKDAYQFDWDGADDGEIVAVTQLSTVHFTNDLHGQLDDVYWATVFQVGKIVLLVLLVLIMIGLIYLNCTRIKALYERKRTHYFRPYMVDPQVREHHQRTQMQVHLAPGLHRINPAAAGYYDSRNRVV